MSQCQTRAQFRALEGVPLSATDRQMRWVTRTFPQHALELWHAGLPGGGGAGLWEAGVRVGVGGGEGWAVRRPRRQGTAVVCVAVGRCACFPGGPFASGSFWSLSRGPRPAWLQPLPVAAGLPSAPQPRTPHPVLDGWLPEPLPMSEAEPASSQVGGLQGGVVRESRGARYAAGERSPRPAVVLGFTGGGREPRQDGPAGAREAIRRPGCRGTAPVLEASGREIPRHAPAADLLSGLFERPWGPSRWREATPPPRPVLCCCHVFATSANVAAPRRCPSPSARQPRPSCLLIPGPSPGTSCTPGPPRSRSFARRRSLPTSFRGG